MRKALQVSVADARLFGTLHESTGNKPVPRSRPGLLLLSFGQQPRSWVGDLGAVIADRIADLGYLVFRFDMPGLGDSPGELPVHLEVLYREIQLGSHETYIHSLCLKLQEDYPFNGLVIGGFCGGAVTALYSVLFKDINLKGLFLLEPEIGLTQIDTPSSKSKKEKELSVRSYLTRRRLLIHRLLSAQSWKNLLSGNIDFKFWNSIIIITIKRIIRRLLRRVDLPAETNYKLLDAWKKARTRSIPTLVLSMGAAIRRTYYRSYGLSSGCDNPGEKFTWIEIPKTTHALLAGGAKEAVCNHVTQWFLKYFP